jgi:hypothetical protein
MPNNEPLDLQNEIPSDRYNIEKRLWHPEKARMKLAYIVLIGIFFLFILSLIVSWLAKIGYMCDETSRSMFELCRTGLLPIVTLILGYYFSKNN